MDLPALFAACRTEADFYRAQIAAENLLAPAEVAALADRAGDLPAPAGTWLAIAATVMAAQQASLSILRIDRAHTAMISISVDTS